MFTVDRTIAEIYIADQAVNTFASLEHVNKGFEKCAMFFIQQVRKLEMKIRFGTLQVLHHF